MNDKASSVSECRVSTPFLSVDEYLRAYRPTLEQPKPLAKKSALIQGPTLVSNEVEAVHKPGNDANEYNEDNMRVLESMLAQMDLESGDEQDNEVDTPQQHESIAASRESPELPATYAPHKILTHEDESVVRLTLPVYNSMLQERDKYKANSERLQEAVTYLKENFAESRGSLESVSNGLTPDRNTSNIVPNSEVGASLQQKGRSIGYLTTALVSLPQLEAGIQQPQSELNNTLPSETTRFTQPKHEITKFVENKDLEIARLQKCLGATEQQKDEIIKVLTAERDTLLHEQRHARDYTKDRQELVDTITLREKKIEELCSEIETEKAQRAHLSSQLQQKGNHPNPSNQITKLQDDLKAKDKRVYALNSDLHIALKKISDTEVILNRLSLDKEFLKGTIHLVEPLARTKLPKNVLGCFECYVMNMTCDRSAPCHNCRDNNEKCRRWKCALKHVTKTCPYYPACDPKHCENGWVVSSQTRPEW